MTFISKEQEIVVKSRIGLGYACEAMPNGFWRCIKGKHRMEINGLGFDTYVGVR